MNINEKLLTIINQFQFNQIISKNDNNLKFIGKKRNSNINTIKLSKRVNYNI